MNSSQFNISIYQSIELLKEFKLFKNTGPKPIGKYSNEIKDIKGDNHISLYRAAIENLDFEILLIDNSIFQFSNINDIRYAFIQNPNKFVSKEEFIAEIFVDEINTMTAEELKISYELIEESEYEQYLNEQGFNISSNYFRYDVTQMGYKPLLHSYSHLHIGMNENLRIPTSIILTPLKFVLFCIKNTYYDVWKCAIDKMPGFMQKISNSKTDCKPLNRDFWQTSEKYELYLE